MSLFGNVSQKEFESAINSFKDEFSVNLKLLRQADFLYKIYHSKPVKGKKRKYKLLSQLCEVRFIYDEEQAVLADVSILTDKGTLTKDEFVFLYWHKGSWFTEENYLNLRQLRQ